MEKVKSKLILSTGEYFFESFKGRYNIKSVIWFFFNFTCLAFLTKLSCHIIGVFFNTDDKFMALFTYIQNFAKSEIIAIIISFFLIILCLVCIVRFIYVFCYYIIGLFNANRFFRSQPYPRIKYITIRHLIDSIAENTVHIGFFDGVRDSYSAVGISIRNTFICTSFWGYVVLISACYVDNFTGLFEGIANSIGVSYLSHKESKIAFRKEENENTEKLIKGLITEIESMKEF